MDISDGASARGAVSLFVRGRKEAKAVKVAPQPVTVDASISCAPVDALGEYSADGSLLAMVEKDGVRVLRADGGVEVLSVPRPQVQALSLSPRGTFLLTWERLQEGEKDGNLRVWRVATGELACAWHQKVLGEKALWPAIKWSVDETLAYRLVTNEIHFFDGQQPTVAALHKLRIENVSQCSIEPTGAPHHVASFVPEKKGAPAQLRLWRHPDYGEGRFLSTKAFYKAEQVGGSTPRSATLSHARHAQAHAARKNTRRAQRARRARRTQPHTPRTAAHATHSRTRHTHPQGRPQCEPAT